MCVAYGTTRILANAKLYVKYIGQHMHFENATLGQNRGEKSERTDGQSDRWGTPAPFGFRQSVRLPIPPTTARKSRFSTAFDAMLWSDWSVAASRSLRVSSSRNPYPLLHHLCRPRTFS
eukprot:scaffold766_cov179-Amphora_coffeaeformis.AAC.3